LAFYGFVLWGSSAEGATLASIPDVPFVVFDLVSIQQLYEFSFEVATAVMFLLPLDCNAAPSALLG